MTKYQALWNRFPGLWRLAIGGANRKIPIVRELTATDCGAAALAMIIRFHGKAVSLEEVRAVTGAGRDGTTAAAILRAGRLFGLRGRVVRAEPENLGDLPKASILHWEFAHFVVYDAQKREHVRVIDPAVGRRSVPMEHFRRSFTGIAIILEPSENFTTTERKPRRLLELLSLISDRRDIILRIVLVSCLIQLLSLAMPLLMGFLIDRVIPHKEYTLLALLAISYGGLQLFSSFASFIRSHLMIYLRVHLDVSFTMRFLDHLIDLPYSFFQQRTYGDLLVRLSSNNSVRAILTTTALTALMDGAMASMYLVILIIISSPLTVLVMLVAIARIGIMALMRWKQRQFLEQTIDNQAKSDTRLVELLSGMETLKAMGLEQTAADQWANVFVDGLNISIKRGRLEAIFGLLLGAVSMVSALIMTFYGTYLVLRDTWSLGVMVAYTAVVSGFLGPLNNVVSVALQLQMLEVHLERMNDVMNSPLEQTVGVDRAISISGAVRLEGASFRYSEDGPLVLDDVSFVVPSGARIAIVGLSGSGKSTLARLLAGLYKPTSGRILFDEMDLRSLDLRSIRGQLGVVTQECQLFGGSIRQNIALSDRQMALDRIIHAAKMACVHEDVVAMQMGYDTILADHGRSLSGGQRQRLAIARAIASSPKVLVLDEATSHLDAIVEAKVHQNLATLQCTTIVIAHRLSTIRDSNVIIVLGSGRVIGLGRHDDLLHVCPQYAQLVGAQEARRFAEISERDRT